MYGPTRPRPQAEGEEEGGAEPDCPGAAEGFQFAPRDTASWQATGKEDVHGIGYRGMEEQTVLSAQSASRALYGMSGEVGQRPCLLCWSGPLVSQSGGFFSAVYDQSDTAVAINFGPQ